MLSLALSLLVPDSPTLSTMTDAASEEFLKACVEMSMLYHSSSVKTSIRAKAFDLKERSASYSPPTSPENSDSELEAKLFYYGLPSNPVLVFRTGAPWRRPAGIEAYLVPKVLTPVFDNEIAAVWDEMGTQIFLYLDSITVMWTTIDVVRFAEAKQDEVIRFPDSKQDLSPVVVWIGVEPGTLTREHAEVAAAGCTRILDHFNITDVEVAFRESIFTPLGGPKLLKYVASGSATADVCSPLTSALGLPIAALDTPHTEGTGALYLSEGGDSEKVYILTARHTVLPPVPNTLYHHTQITQRPREIILLGHKAFQALLKSTMDKVSENKFMIGHYNRVLEDVRKEVSEEIDDVEGLRVRAVERKLKAVESSIKPLDQFHNEVTKHWGEESQRIIGHVAYSPPITFGASTERFTEDWALIELDRDKIEWESFRGNVIDLGTKIPELRFIAKMYPNQKSFNYPSDRLLPVRGVIGETELRHPQTNDANGEPCLVVIKNGCTTGTTIGRATGMKSFVRHVLPDGTRQTSMQWAILGYDSYSVVFSEKGDSGAIIVDGKGRIGGLLTAGSGATDCIDITYATPFHWLLERVKAHFPNAHLYQPPA